MITSSQTRIVSHERAMELFAKMRKVAGGQMEDSSEIPKCVNNPHSWKSRKSMNPGNAIANRIPHEPNED